ncbi:GNAT family protein [Streptomyces sp. NPDC007369]|uniref:GNAT family N-acetyltransferase n=1 Tax=Streptomyces sp. NPDC007369 TaxID=3154589 RepID=UPI00340C45C9
MEEPAANLDYEWFGLRRWHMSDVDALERAIHESRDHLAHWMPWAAGADREHVVGFLARNQEQWESRQTFGYAITSDGVVVGTCCLMRRSTDSLDIGYWLHPEWTGRGLATTATAALVDQGFQLTGIDHVEIHHDAANSASEAVARRLGFTEIERVEVPEGPATPGEVGVDVVWRMTADQWKAKSGWQRVAIRRVSPPRADRRAPSNPLGVAPGTDGRQPPR